MPAVFGKPPAGVVAVVAVQSVGEGEPYQLVPLVVCQWKVRPSPSVMPVRALPA